VNEKKRGQGKKSEFVESQISRRSANVALIDEKQGDDIGDGRGTLLGKKKR